MKKPTLACALALAVAGALPLAAQDDTEPAPRSDRLALVAHGLAVMPADQVDVEVAVEGMGEDGATAEKKHRDKLKAVLAALATEAEEPGLPLEIRERRSILGVRSVPAQDASLGNVSVATAVVARLKAISLVPPSKLRKRLARILDAVVEAGADLGAGGVGARPAFRFRVKDNEALREASHRDALAKGREAAARLAKLAGRALGPLTLVTERAWHLRAGSSQQDAVGFDVVVGRLGNNVPNNHEMTVSATEIELETELALEWELR